MQRGLSANDVSIELLESILIEDRNDQAARTIQTLAEHGFDVHLDDFGTGYASMSNLATLEISGLKIDRSLISDLSNEKSVQIINAISITCNSYKAKILLRVQ